MNLLRLLSLVQGLLLLVGAPAFLGWLNWWKARLTRRRRPLTCVVQPYRDLIKLLRLPATYAKPTSWVFRLTPVIVFAAYGSLLFTLPFFTRPLLAADLVLILYLLGLARFTLSLAGLDSASSFGGLGSNREMFFHFLTEISFFAVILALWLWSNVGAAAPTQSNALLRIVALLAVILAFFPVILLEARRLPVDNLETHLELTMAGKAVGLEFSGRDLALVEWAETNKLFFMVALWSQLPLTLFEQAPRSVFLSLLLWLLAGAFLAWWEQRTPKLRLGRVPSVAQMSLLLSLFAILVRLIPGG